MRTVFRNLLKICIAVILLAAILFIIINIYLNSQVECKAYQIWLDDFTADELKTDNQLKELYGITDEQLDDMRIHPGNYIHVQIDYSAESKSDIIFHNTEAKNTYNKDFVVGTKSCTVLCDTPEIPIKPGKNSELAFSFIVKGNGKTKEEVFKDITKGKIYITGSFFIFSPRWKLDLSHLQTYTSIQQVK